MKKQGFTLIELLIVIAIIGVLSSIILTAVTGARKNAMAARVLFDMREIKKAWTIWQIDTGTSFYPEDSYGTSNAQWPCHDDPLISQTDLAQNVLGLPNWNGPYLPQWPADMFGRQYGYDSDNDTFSVGNPYGGVNVFIGWCPGDPRGGQYIEFAQLLDRKVDGGDGWRAGIVRWDGDGDYGQISLLISPSP